MPNITTCTRCGKAYEEGSEEAANAPDKRLCPKCFGIESGHAAFTKVVRLGTISVPRHCGSVRVSVFCKIEYAAGKLSISGVEGPAAHGGYIGAWGQIDMHLRGHEENIQSAPGWNIDALRKFFAVWERWHLNNLTAGSPAQEEFLRTHAAEWKTYKANAGSIPSHYTWACEVLAAAGLHPDPGHNGYRYGSAWLREEVPEDVLIWLNGLPSTDVTPAWV